jgi:hypothetical protein
MLIILTKNLICVIIAAINSKNKQRKKRWKRIKIEKNKIRLHLPHGIF